MRSEYEINDAIGLIVARLSAISTIEYEYDTKSKDRRSAEWRALMTERAVLRSQLAGLCWARGDDARLGVIGHPLNGGKSVGGGTSCERSSLRVNGWRPYPLRIG
jgi:hypothetical protein